VLVKDFREYMPQVSHRLKEASLAAALEFGRVVRHVPPSAAGKVMGRTSKVPRPI
jgi:hypothetical protein